MLLAVVSVMVFFFLIVAAFDVMYWLHLKNSGLDAGTIVPILKVLGVTTAVATGALLAMVYFYVSQKILKPLENLVGELETIRRGGAVEKRVSVYDSNREVSVVARTLNEMFVELGSYQSDLEGKVAAAVRELKEQERKVNASQRHADIGRLAAGLAHEINSPLGGMMNALAKIEKGDLAPERRRIYFELLAEGFGQIRDIVQNILVFARHDERPAEELDVAESVRGALKLLEHRMAGCDVSFTFDPADGEFNIVAHPREIGQVFVNVLANALDAVGAKGRIEIGLRNDGKSVTVSVRDDGRGMTADTLERAFEPFYTTKDPGKGTGLGLSICREIVERHGGEIALTAQAGGGCLATICLPVGEGK